MTVWVALLRGINVGSAHRLAMAELRRILENEGYGDVRTLLNSGNAVFTTTDHGSAAALEASISRAISNGAGFEVPVLLRTASELGAVVDGNPFPARQVPSKELGAVFLASKPARSAFSDLVPADYEPAEYAVGDSVIYVHQPDGVLGSPLPDWKKVLAMDVTHRNWNTTVKLHDLASSI